MAMTEKNPLFSTYRQGENRVTASMLAVFERIDSSLVGQLLAAASEESTLDWIQYRNQVGGSASVPDAEILGAFHYLFEIKVKPASLQLPQLRHHLKCFRDVPAQRLFVITPDGGEPAVIARVDDERVTWLSFLALDRAIAAMLEDPARLVSEHDRLLLTELRGLFAAEKLLIAHDTVIVAAKTAYPDYLRTASYVCQPGRSFRPGLRYLGFYSAGEIKPEIARIEYHEDGVVFSQKEARRLARSKRPVDRRIGGIMATLLGLGRRLEGGQFQLFVLSEPESAKTIRRDAPIPHPPGPDGAIRAWTQGQRYADSTRLRTASTTADLLGDS